MVDEAIEEAKEDCKVCPNYDDCKRNCWEEQIKICMRIK